MKRILDGGLLDVVGQLNQPFIPVLGPDMRESGSGPVRSDHPPKYVGSGRVGVRTVIDPSPTKLTLRPNDHRWDGPNQRRLEIGQDDLRSSAAPVVLLVRLHVSSMSRATSRPAVGATPGAQWPPIFGTGHGPGRRRAGSGQSD